MRRIRRTARTTLISLLLSAISAAAGCRDTAPVRAEPDFGVARNQGPYSLDMHCTASTVEDLGPSSGKRIENAMPGRLRLGSKIELISEDTDWKIIKTFKLDGAQWAYVRLEETHPDGSRVLDGHAIDLDRNGTIDWIKIFAGPSNPALDGIADMIGGGKTEFSLRRTLDGCIYDRRRIFHITTRAPSDRDLGENAYCAAELSCRITDKPLCGNTSTSPTLVLDNVGKYSMLTLAGNGRFHRAHPERFSPPADRRICDSLTQPRPYL